MRVMPKLSQEGSTKPPSSTMPAGVCQIVILSTSAGAPLTASAHAPTLPATASGICYLAGLLQQTAQGHTKALIHQPFSSVTQGCQQKQGPSICYVSKARDALKCQAMGQGTPVWTVTVLPRPALYWSHVTSMYAPFSNRHAWCCGAFLGLSCLPWSVTAQEHGMSAFVHGQNNALPQACFTLPAECQSDQRARC